MTTSFNRRTYKISNYCFINCYQGQFYLNGIEVGDLAGESILLDGQKFQALLRFSLPADPQEVVGSCPADTRQEIEAFIHNLALKNFLVDGEEQEASAVPRKVAAMLKTLAAVNSNMLLAYAQNKAKEKNNFLDPALASQKNRDVIDRLRGNGLEIGGHVKGISGNVSCTRLDMGFDQDEHTIKGDATNLKDFTDGQFDFVINSHTLEHIPNPIKALLEWKRVVRTGGHLYFIVPNRDFTNDHKRPLTPLSHLIDDYENDVGLDDKTHLPEIMGSLTWHAMERFVPLRSPYLHHHTWTMETLLELLAHTGLDVVEYWETFPFHLHILATR